MTTTTGSTAGAAPTGPAPAKETGAALGRLLFGFFPTQVLHVAATLGLVDHLADGPRTVEDLARATGTHGPSLHRVLRALACFGVLDEVAPGTYGRGRHADGLAEGGPSSMVHLVRLFAGRDVWRSWGELDETVRTGEPAWHRVTGASSFETFAADPEQQASFNKAMAEGTRRAAPGIVAAGRFERFSTVVDVGGGDGTLLAAVLAAHPDLRGTVFDTPSGVAGADRTLADAGVADRASVATGDFFGSVPTGADAYLVKSVVHDWDDERATQLLRRVHEAATDESALLVVEPLMPTAPAASPEVLMLVMSDLNMLVCTGGRERTEAEMRDLLAGAGFEVRSVTPAPGSAYNVVEAVPVA